MLNFREEWDWITRTLRLNGTGITESLLYSLGKRRFSTDFLLCTFDCTLQNMNLRDKFAVHLSHTPYKRLNEQRHRVDRRSGSCISMLGCAFRAHSRPWSVLREKQRDEEQRRDVKEGMLNAECRSLRANPRRESRARYLVAGSIAESPGNRRISSLIQPPTICLSYSACNRSYSSHRLTWSAHDIFIESTISSDLKF